MENKPDLKGVELVDFGVHKSYRIYCPENKCYYNGNGQPVNSDSTNNQSVWFSARGASRKLCTIQEAHPKLTMTLVTFETVPVQVDMMVLQNLVPYTPASEALYCDR